jgi:ATP phosphoribosyltransferase
VSGALPPGPWVWSGASLRPGVDADHFCIPNPLWVGLFTVLEERRVRELIPQLYAAGARGIIELPLNKIVE